MINFKAIQFVGTQRSGSNLLRLILNQHKLISAPHPPHLLNTFHNLLPHYGNLENKVNRSLLVNDLCEWIANNPVEWTNINLDRDEIVDNCKNLIDIFEYVFIVKCKADNARIWCCKSTFNIEYTDQLEKGIKPFYIYLYRDGRDVAVSFKKAIVGPKHVYHIAKKWVHEQRQTRVFLDSVDSNRFIAISYEQMIHKPHMIINEICKKLEITYQDEMMNYFTSEESQHTAESGRMWSNVTKPIIRNNIANYKRQLTTGDIEIFEAIAGEELIELGYSLAGKGKKKIFTDSEIKEFDSTNDSLIEKVNNQASPADIAHRAGQKELMLKIVQRFNISFGSEVLLSR